MAAGPSSPRASRAARPRRRTDLWQRRCTSRSAGAGGWLGPVCRPRSATTQPTPRPSRRAPVPVRASSLDNSAARAPCLTASLPWACQWLSVRLAAGLHGHPNSPPRPGQLTRRGRATRDSRNEGNCRATSAGTKLSLSPAGQEEGTTLCSSTPERFGNLSEMVAVGPRSSKARRSCSADSRRSSATLLPGGACPACAPNDILARST